MAKDGTMRGGARVGSGRKAKALTEKINSGLSATVIDLPEPEVKVPFLVKVNISDLNIRKGPGVGCDRVQFCPVGVYTIMEVKAGQGSKAGWGRLKSGIGWLSLDYVKRI